MEKTTEKPLTIHGIPTTLRDKFKSLCVANGSCMKEEVLGFIKSYCRKGKTNE